jgi:hypothetical protein
MGQAEAEGDIEHSGYDFNFTIHETDTKAIDYWGNVVSLFSAGKPLPDVSLVVITNYIDPSIPAKTETLQEVVLKLDERAASSKKDYIKNMFTGFAPNKV